MHLLCRRLAGEFFASFALCGYALGVRLSEQQVFHLSQLGAQRFQLRLKVFEIFVGELFVHVLALPWSLEGFEMKKSTFIPENAFVAVGMGEEAAESGKLSRVCVDDVEAL